MVDGRALTEVLTHHQHVLDRYRFSMMRSFDAARIKRRAGAPSLGNG